MKIVEVTNESRKIINRLQHLYASYDFDDTTYDALIEFMVQHNENTDSDVIREIKLIDQKLYEETIRLLRK